MKYIGHFLALILATILSFIVSSWVLDRTLWSAAYLQRQADQSGLYAKLATALPQSLAVADPEAGKSGLTALSPALVQGQFSSLIPQFVAHIHDAGPTPTIDLAAFAAAVGQPIPAGTATTQQLSLGSADANVVRISQNLRTTAAYAPLAALALILLIVGVMRGRRLSTLARASFEASVALGLSTGLFWLIPGLLPGLLSQPTLVPIRTTVLPFITGITHGIASQLGTAALAFLGLSILLELTHSSRRLIARFTPKPKISPKATPSSTNPTRP